MGGIPLRGHFRRKGVFLLSFIFLDRLYEFKGSKEGTLENLAEHFKGYAMEFKEMVELNEMILSAVKYGLIDFTGETELWAYEQGQCTARELLRRLESC